VRLDEIVDFGVVLVAELGAEFDVGFIDVPLFDCGACGGFSFGDVGHYDLLHGSVEKAKGEDRSSPLPYTPNAYVLAII
jgi:hypothetical protein